MKGSKFLSLAGLWGLALALSALVVAAGRLRSDPPAPSPGWVAALVLGPPLMMALWLLLRWRLPPAGEGGESGGDARERR
ncbi:MAG: hypothetical protein VKI81_01920 [Synechococcaceae cyanobacterium]|nr:hypothetical protein [Synechococcaceae cyanobacterium]